LTAFGEEMALWDVPFELVGEVASAGAVAEAGDVESSTASARHDVASIKSGMWFRDTDAVVETSRGVLRVEVMARRRSSARGERLEQTELAGPWREPHTRHGPGTVPHHRKQTHVRLRYAFIHYPFDVIHASNWIKYLLEAR